MSRIKNAEHSQLVAEMRRRVAELEIEASLVQTVFLFIRQFATR